MKKTNKWLNYYRASLIDGNRTNKNFNIKFIEREECIISKFKKDEIVKFWKENEGGEETLINEIELAPFYITSETLHGVNKGKLKKHFPFWIKARVNKEGVLTPPKEPKFPVFLREFLSPSPSNTPTITSIEKLDNLIGKSEISIENWEKYWHDCENLFFKITNKKFEDYHEKGNYQFSISDSNDDSVITNILKLYDALTNRKNKTEYPLLKTILQEEPEPKNHELTELEIFLNSNHFGQMSGDFPLSESQRVAFAQFSSEYNKKAFAINGPPGTGKTFILQSFIANIVSNSVLKKTKAPLIIGSSTNNQAITNILDSMSLDKAEGLNTRWIPNTNSFGLYLCSKDKAKTKKYQSATSKYLNDFFLNELEDYSKIEGYKAFFKEKLTSHFSIKNFKNDAIKPLLLKKINQLKNTITEIINIVRDTYNVPVLLITQNLQTKDDLTTKIHQLNEELTKNLSRQDDLKRTLHQLEHKNANFPIHVKLLPFKKFKEIKFNSFKLIANSYLNDLSNFNEWDNYSKVNSKLEELLLNIIQEKEIIEKNLSELVLIEKEINKRNEAYNNFKLKWHNTYANKWSTLISRTKDEYNNLDILRDTAVKLDISYRYELFWLCVHYREWEYIEELEQKKENEVKYEKENKELGEKNYANKLRRIAKICPLYIATFHSLPKFATYFEYGEGEKYYTELFDLMIVDESGQVSPEIAIPSLSLTKKILTVGDIHQIEPVWNVTKNIDYYNATKYDIVKSVNDFERNAYLGFNASNGSLMKITRNATPFNYKHQNNKLEKGAYLLEHRRCLNAIAEYSKDHIYSGSLKLMGGETNDRTSLPPLGYIHIDGYSEKHNGSSKKNIKEAKAIVQWIIHKREELETAYSKSIDKVLAIVTPFSAQTIIIKDILKNTFEKEIAENLIVGTVHALQGAERNVILFSSVHDKEDNSLFFDFEGKFNMLNVALTRAKHSFIVVGNMAIFNPKDKTPSGKLAEKLFSNDTYALNESFVFKSELIYENIGNQITRIDSLDKHRRVLKRCFEVAKNQLIIFSPFISINAIEDDNIIQLIKESISNNVKVLILTDENLDKTQGHLKNSSKLGRDAIIKTNAEFIIVNGIHNKTICIDDETLIEGSFNWLSASRDVNSIYHRNETSVVIKGELALKEILKIKEKFSLNQTLNN